MAIIIIPEAWTITPHLVGVDPRYTLEDLTSHPHMKRVPRPPRRPAPRYPILKQIIEDREGIATGTTNPPCRLCGVRPPTWDDLQIDHVIPYSAGGCDHPHNLRWSCRPCNIARSNRSVAMVWYNVADLYDATSCATVNGLSGEWQDMYSSWGGFAVLRAH